MLELLERKRSRAVLRGERNRKAPNLPDLTAEATVFMLIPGEDSMIKMNILKSAKETDNKLRWDALIGDTRFSLYIPK